MIWQGCNHSSYLPNSKFQAHTYTIYVHVVVLYINMGFHHICTLWNKNESFQSQIHHKKCKNRPLQFRNVTNISSYVLADE